MRKKNFRYAHFSAISAISYIPGRFYISFGHMRKKTSAMPIFQLFQLFHIFQVAFISVVGICEKKLPLCPFFQMILGTDIIFFSICPKLTNYRPIYGFFDADKAFLWAFSTVFFLYAQSPYYIASIIQCIHNTMHP